MRMSGGYPMYILGIDGGGTKTHCLIGDEKGHILAEGFGGPANYQLCGLETTRASIEMAIQKALQALKTEASVCLEDITVAVLGLSGADGPSDYEALNQVCSTIFKEVPFKIFNDCWIGLRSGSEGYGVISICGTGGAHAGKGINGEEYIFRNINYILGSRGGGEELVDTAIHYAFRSNEGTYKKSSLEDKIMNIFEVYSMDELCQMLRENKMTPEHAFKIPVAVFEAAHEGDVVSCEIISEMGRTEGQYASAIINKLKLNKEQVPMVLIGSMFKLEDPLLIEPYMAEVNKIAPKAYYKIPKVAPVYGAYYIGLDGLGFMKFLDEKGF